MPFPGAPQEGRLSSPSDFGCQWPVLQSPLIEAATWTAIGLFAAISVGSLFYLGSRIDLLGSRIDALAARLDARIDAQSADLGSRIDAQGVALGARIDALTAKLDDHLLRHAG